MLEVCISANLINFLTLHSVSLRGVRKIKLRKSEIDYINIAQSQTIFLLSNISISRESGVLKFIFRNIFGIFFFENLKFTNTVQSQTLHRLTLRRVGLCAD